MAKGQKRGNREIRKPKMKKEPAAPSVALNKGTQLSIGVPSKKYKKS